MQAPKIPEDEVDRLAALHALGVLDTPPDERFDRYTRIAKSAFGVPIALVSLIDGTRQWFKSRTGLKARETPRTISFCGHAILDDCILEIPDTTADERFHDNPLVIGSPFIRFYAGAPLHSPGGYPLGTLCLIDTQPRQLSIEQRLLLRDLADAVQSELARIGIESLRAELDDKRTSLESASQKTAKSLETEQALERSNRELEQFAYIASHDLRQPLRMVAGYLQIIEKRLTGSLDTETREMLDYAVDGARRMNQMLDSLLDYSRIGRDKQAEVVFDSGLILNEVLRFLAPAAHDTNATINIAGTWPMLHGHPDEFSRLLQNLIANAIKFHRVHTPPVVQITSEYEADNWLFSVADNGIGIAEERLSSA